MKKRKYSFLLQYFILTLLLLVGMAACDSPNSKDTGEQSVEDESQLSNKAIVEQSAEALPQLIDGGIYKIINKASGRALNTQMAGMVDGSTVQQYIDTNTFDELWRVQIEDGYYTFENLLTPRYLSVRKDSNEIGSLIEVKLPEEDNLHKWNLSVKDDAYQMLPYNSTLTLGLTENTIKSSFYPQLLEYSEQDYELWQFKKVDMQEDLPIILPVEGDVFHSSCPQIVKYGDTYYMYIMAPGISIKTSTDLIHWETVGQAFPGSNPSWLGKEVPGYGIWAPSVYAINGKYYLYYCISTEGSQNSAIGLAENVTLDYTSPDFKWVDKGMVIRSYTGDDYNCIDPNIFINDNGEAWLTFGSYWQGIFQRQIDSDTGLLLEENTEVFHIAKRYASNGAIEAPYIIKRNDYYYLFMAFNPMDKSYQNRVGRSTSLHGTYYDREGRSLLKGGATAVTESLDELLMPGHASVFLNDDGQYYLVSEYFRKDSASIMMIGTIVWDEEDWPITALTPDAVTLLQDTIK